MAAATVNFQKKFSVGPVNIEWINATVTDGETVDTLMQNPEYAVAVTNVNGGDGTSVSISGKTLTLANTGITDVETNILVVGF